MPTGPVAKQRLTIRFTNPRASPFWLWGPEAISAFLRVFLLNKQTNGGGA